MQTIYLMRTKKIKNETVFTKIKCTDQNYAAKLAKKLVTTVFSLASVASVILPSFAISSNRALSDALKRKNVILNEFFSKETAKLFSSNIPHNLLDVCQELLFEFGDLRRVYFVQETSYTAVNYSNLLFNSHGN